MVKIYKRARIYILSPANLATGGPEALHQLGYNISKYTKYKKVYMQYYPISNKKSIHQNYKRFKLKVSKKIEDKKENILIIPEMYNLVKFSNRFSKIKKAIWWLSFDNFFLSKFESSNHKHIKSLIKIPYKIIVIFNRLTNFYFGNFTFNDYLKMIYLKINLFNKDKFENINYHFFQSSYVGEFLKKNKLKNYSLSDYLNKSFLKIKKINLKDKRNIITYNAAKSTIFMKKIIKTNPDYTFIPLVNLPKKKIIDYLKISKIYFDFGTHPGKDRIPREAAILGNCIITNNKGSSANKSDVKIYEEFKFDEKFSNLIKIRNKINIIFNNHLKEQNKFKKYIKKINLEKKVFMSEIKKIFS